MKIKTVDTPIMPRFLLANYRLFAGSAATTLVTFVRWLTDVAGSNIVISIPQDSLDWVELWARKEVY